MCQQISYDMFKNNITGKLYAYIVGHCYLQTIRLPLAGLWGILDI